MRAAIEAGDSTLAGVVITVPSCRPAPLKALSEFYPFPAPVLLISDPARREEHERWVAGEQLSGVHVVEGRRGPAPQAAKCYRQAHLRGFKWLFRLDDDVTPGIFVHKEKGVKVSLFEAIGHALNCALQLGVSCAGFANTSNRFWLAEQGEPPVYSKTYGLIHGGAQLCRSRAETSSVIDERLPHYDDVYRTAAHREESGGYCGRVPFIGLDKSSSTTESTIKDLDGANPFDDPSVREAVEIITKRFPGIVTCQGARKINSGRLLIPNWRFRPPSRQARLFEIEK